MGKNTDIGPCKLPDPKTLEAMAKAVGMRGDPQPIHRFGSSDDTTTGAARKE